MSYRALVIRYLLVLCLVLCKAVTANAEEIKYLIELPAQTVAESLNALSEETDIPVFFPYKLANLRQANPVSGRYMLQEAVNIMLKGTGLSGGLSNKGVLVISLKKSEAPNENQKEGDQMISKKNSNRSLIAGIAALFSSIVAPNVLAQDAGSDSRSGGIEEITVTAQKREENLQDVPIAVTALSGDTFELAGGNNIADIDKLVPNMQTTQSGGRGDAAIFIRGVGQKDPLVHADVGVGVYVDGVFYSRVIGAAMETNDIERLEVLRGPQGTLYGKNTIGGAINIVTTLPHAEKQLEVSAGVSSFDGYQFSGKFNNALTDNLFVRGSGYYRENDGYFDNVFTGDDDWSDTQNFGGRVALRFEPNEDMDFTLTYEYRDVDNGPVGWKVSDNRTFALLALSGVTPNLLSPAEGGPVHDLTADFRGDEELESNSITGVIEVDFDNFSIKSITNYQDIHSFRAMDFEGLTGDVLNQDFVRLEQDQWSTELQFYGNAFEDNLRWLAGFYFLQEDISYHELDSIGVAGVGVVPLLEVNTSPETDTYAIFGQGTWSLTERLSLTLGGRYNVDDKKLNHIWIDGGGAPFTGNLQADWESFTTRLSIDYALYENLMTYFTYSEGFKSGQVPSRASSQAQFFSLSPEVVESYEMGIKSLWFEDRLVINAAGFHVKYEDLQLQIFSTDAQGRVQFTEGNVSAEMNGVEIEWQAALSENTRLGGSIAYMDSFYTTDTSGILGAGGVPLLGDQLEYSPEWQFSIFGQHELALSDYGSLLLRVDWSWVDDQFLEPSNHISGFQPSYGLLNAQARFTTANGKIEIALSGKNITDEEYINFVLGNVAGSGLTVYAPPVNWSLDFTYRFF